MALQRDYNIPYTSFIVSGAYHLVTDVEIKKRNNDDPGPVATAEPINYAPLIYPDTPNERPLTDEDKLAQIPLNAIPTGSFEVDRTADGVYWENGYTAQIQVEIYANKAARDSAKNPIGKIGINTTEISPQVATKGMDGKIMFRANVASEDNILSQAYTYLKSTDYYSGSIDI
jgi:hypothetical protein